VIRVDLPLPAQVSEVVDELADHAELQTDDVILLCYSDTAHGRDALELLLVACRNRGLQVFDAILVRAEAAEFLPDDSGVTDPPIALPGPDDPTRRALTEATALAGHRILRNRDELRASVAPPAGLAAIGAKRAVQAAAAQLAAELVEADDRAGLLRRSASLALEAARLEHRGDHRVSAATAARLALCVSDRWARDPLVAHVLAADPRMWVPVLIDAVCRVPADVSADLCTLLAAAAYRSGDGALALVALDRCLAAEPRHRFGGMLMHMLQNGLHPSTLQDLANPLPVVRQPASDLRQSLAFINRAAGGSTRPRPTSPPATPVSSLGGPGSPPVGT
jgi:hypothetical protein